MVLAANARVRQVADVVGMPDRLVVPSGFAAGDSVDEEMVLDGAATIRQELIDQGYLQAEVDVDTSSASAGLFVTYRIHAGTQAHIKGWRLRGCEAIDEKKLLRAMPKKGAVFSKKILEKAVYVILNSCEKSGFPLAEVVPASVIDSGELVCPTLLVREGPLVMVGYLEFFGSRGLSKSVLVRLARFRAGRVYSPVTVRKWKRNLEKSGLVRVNSEELVFEKGYGVRFRVTKRRGNRASGMLGYSADTKQLNGLVELKLGNILNTGRRLQAGWQAFAGRTRYDFSYTEPWLLGWWLSVTCHVQHRVTDTIRSQTSFAVGAELLTSPDFILSFESGFEQTASIDTSENGQTTWAGTGFEIDTRNTDFNPRRGEYLNIKTRVGNRSSHTASAKFIGRFESDFGFLWPVFGPFVLADFLHYRLVYSHVSLPEFELYHMGGAASLRGYYEEEFCGTEIGLWNCELRYGVSSSFMAYPFFDAGVAKSSSSWIFRPAYGVGFRAGTRIGTLGIDYGVAIGSDPLEGKVHLSFAGEF